MEKPVIVIDFGQRSPDRVDLDVIRRSCGADTWVLYEMPEQLSDAQVIGIQRLLSDLLSRMSVPKTDTTEVRDNILQTFILTVESYGRAEYRLGDSVDQADEDDLRARKATCEEKRQHVIAEFKQQRAWLQGFIFHLRDRNDRIEELGNALSDLYDAYVLTDQKWEQGASLDEVKGVQSVAAEAARKALGLCDDCGESGEPF